MAVHATAGMTSEGMEALERFRPELTGYCYRMLGSAFEAEDAVQEAFLRAWRKLDTFEGRSALKSWLYRFATNVGLDMLDGRKRRAQPVDLSPAGTPQSPLETLPDTTWLEPIPDALTQGGDGDPAAQAERRETLRLAFVAALQHLPPRQRAVLVLREVLRWKAAEVAELLDTSVASVNSSLQRARASLDAAAPSRDGATGEPDPDEQELLGRYLRAFEAYDMDALVALLHEDATMSMPPYRLWLRGREAMLAWFVGTGAGCRGSRLIPVRANGAPAFGQYRPSEKGAGWEPWGLQVLDVSGGRVRSLQTFLDTARVFPLFGLPDRLEPGDVA